MMNGELRGLLLPIAYCQLPTADCLLPTADYKPPNAQFSLRPKHLSLPADFPDLKIDE
jgi:hypothetical protein